MKRYKYNPWGKRIRIGLSLGVMLYGLITGNWLGLAGLVTLFSAISGTCPLTISFTRR